MVFLKFIVYHFFENRRLVVVRSDIIFTLRSNRNNLDIDPVAPYNLRF